jgi:hypothetical protein
LIANNYVSCLCVFVAIFWVNPGEEMTISTKSNYGVNNEF